MVFLYFRVIDGKEDCCSNFYKNGDVCKGIIMLYIFRLDDSVKNNLYLNFRIWNLYYIKNFDLLI